jgi:hypothetical protein
MSPEHRFSLMFCILLSGCAMDAGEASPATEPVHNTDSALCKNALSATEEKTALKLIDDICGDTWCEGDNDFAFERLTCRTGDPTNGGSCALELRIIPREEGSRSYPRVCRTGAFFGFPSLVDTAQNGYQSLDWDYYLALTDCITELESELPR